MPKTSQREEFDRMFAALLASPAPVPPNSGKQLAGVAAIAGQLRALPREDFKAQLKAQLEGRKPMASQAVAAPEARQTATAFLVFKGAARAIEFYKNAFGAIEVSRLNMRADPFGYTWLIATRKEDVTAEEMQKRFDKLVAPSPAAPTAEDEKWKLPVPYIRKGFRTLTPYLLATGAANLIEFLKNAFDAQEILRVPRPGGNEQIMH